MATTQTSWKPGESGNRGGRPPKNEAYTEIIKLAGNKTAEYGGKRIAKKRILAFYLWELIITGTVTFPDGRVIRAEADAWMDAVWKLLERVDGKPKQSLEHSGPDGSPIQTETTAILKAVDYRTIAATLAPGSIPDSNTSGEDQISGDGPTVG